MESPPRIVFLGHEATRTGGPIVLLNLLRWFSANVGWPFQIVLLRGGALVEEFRRVAPTILLDEGLWGVRGPIRLGLGKSGFDEAGRAVHRLLLGGRVFSRPDLVYCNSVSVAPALSVYRRIDCPVLAHVHELDVGFKMSPPDDVARLIHLARRYIACSRAVRDYLVEIRQIPSQNVDVVHGFARGRDDGVTPEPEATALRRSPGEQIVGCVGTVDWRKGTDLFIQLAQIVRERLQGRPVRFVWIGGGEFVEMVHAEHDIGAAGLETFLTIRPAVENPWPYYEIIDVFVLPSREDPFPLVCLEAASEGKPIVCFDAAGGAGELVEEDAGFVVPYLDVSRMADRVIELLRDDELRARMGAAARQKVVARHRVEHAAPKILESMKKTLGRRAEGTD